LINYRKGTRTDEREAETMNDEKTIEYLTETQNKLQELMSHRVIKGDYTILEYMKEQIKELRQRNNYYKKGV